MRKFSTVLFMLLFSGSFLFAQEDSKTRMTDTSFPITVDGSVTALFLDDMNGDNTLAGIQARGWAFDNVDGGGTTTVFQGNPAVFNSYEGPVEGYVGMNYNGANGLIMNQWLISPTVTVSAGDTLKFWQRSPDGSTFPDFLQVWVSTTGGTTAASFDVQIGSFTGSTTGWQQFVGYFPTSGTVTFGIKYFSNNGGVSGTETDYVGFDYFEVLAGTVVNPNTFFDNFDSYTAGLLVACQNPVDWTTWSNAPCGPEDAEVSNAFAYSGANSAKIVTNDDFVKPHGNKTTGKWYMSFMYYVPATKSGYFNTMNVFTLPATFVWGMDVYFDAGGAGRIDTTGGGGVPATTVNFTWAVAQWNQAIVIVDLDTQLAEFWTGTNPLNLTQVATWNWTQGGTKPNSLAVNDFFGATPTDEMYIDDYFFSDEMPTIIPVELTSFAAAADNGNVNLNWSTATELNNSGFQIERSNGGEYQVIGFVAGHGTTTEAKNYSYSDQNVNSGTYSYRLKQIDFDGTFEYSNSIEVEVIGVVEFALGQNYPNPFNPTTTINFSLAEPTFVKLAIYNLLGEELEILKNENMNAGSYNVSFDASSLPSGMYLYKIETAQFSSVRKMMLMK